MQAPPTFATRQDYVSRLADVGLWGLYVAEILTHHGLADVGQDPKAGFNPTYPTFLTGIIDWGDATVTDRNYEIIQLYRDMFACDKALFRTFLEASEWPIDEDFPRQALGMALYRQAVGLTQHHSMDVFEPIPASLPLRDIGTLDELAIELFAP